MLVHQITCAVTLSGRRIHKQLELPYQILQTPSQRRLKEWILDRSCGNAQMPEDVFEHHVTYKEHTKKEHTKKEHT